MKPIIIDMLCEIEGLESHSSLIDKTEIVEDIARLDQSCFDINSPLYTNPPSTQAYT